MSCTSCSSSINGLPLGCKNNGACASGSCDKMNVFDWLSNMSLPNGQEPFNIVEVRFKNGRKGFYRNTKGLTISIGDVVAVESSPGHDVGVVSLTGELVKVQMKKKRVSTSKEDINQVYRKASEKDIEIWTNARNKEVEVQRKSRLIITRLGLKMKLSDVEFQGDGNKATFYYTADERVDFRQLIRELAGTFSLRVEMKQVGLRQEASRLGGIGSCGRELCCSTWLTDFRSVSTSAARYQQLSLNPQKLAGQCGKLKCCLNYELDSYMDALKTFPKTNVWLQTEKGPAVFQKMDIFQGWLWYAYKENPVTWHKLTVAQTNQIIELNRNKSKATSLEEYALELEFEATETSKFTDVVGQDSLTRFDKPKFKRKKKRKNRNFRNNKKNLQKKKN
ncbi:PSP1 domain-containing protein [Lutimonas zeaxanthinifaciens]|uniref:PSP1 domain-containing protein n=1 Tax=Lutimonas zeaxanthinifaciens TaxID=3060215 RepID=UPI00265CC295|nr:regulatory iron-sulfur-containing complex subunit RicT [Lutimonas sp. YSD2104]WKK65879.1 regulatory iron-sulfur-containing complex subunit RicT [Lutimonas sp. YSD2104]